MIDEISGSRFWDVSVEIFGGGIDSFIVQTCKTKDLSYVVSVLENVHPEYLDISVKPTTRPSHLKRCYGDPE